MVMSPRRIRQLPAAGPAKDTDVFPVSQMDDNGSATTRAMTRQQFQQDIIDVISEARQQFVDASNAEHARLHEQLDVVEAKANQNELSTQQMQAALVMIEQMINGESGKTPYDLWLEAGNSGSLQDYLNSLVGPRGPIGPAGAKGEVGERGPPGEQGTTGQQGPTGASGQRGDTGAAGSKGDQGERGPMGLPGAAGAVGPKGDAGPKGDQGDSGATFVGNITIAQTAVVALSAGPRNISVTLNGVVTSGNYLVFPTQPVPAGYHVQSTALATAANTLQVTLTAPLLAIGATYSIPCRVVRINA